MKSEYKYFIFAVFRATKRYVEDTSETETYISILSVVYYNSDTLFFIDLNSFIFYSGEQFKHSPSQSHM